MRNWLAISCLVLIFSFVALLFWYNEWRYSLPTPVPEKYQAVSTKEHIDIGGKFKPKKAGPVFLHFFNPDCPCSRFNMAHFKLLVDEYGEKINFGVVVMTANKNTTEKKYRKNTGLPFPFYLILRWQLSAVFIQLRRQYKKQL